MELITLYSDNKLTTTGLLYHIKIVININKEWSPKVIQDHDLFNVELHDEELVVCNNKQ